MRIHIDTDLGGDIDDLCALALLLRWPDVEIAAITTVAEIDGKRAGYVRHVLNLEHRADIPVAAGADASFGRYRVEQVLLDEARYWGERVPPLPNEPDRALMLLEKSIAQGATIVAIGPFTDLYLLEKQHPGILATARLFLMGGYVYPPRNGFPQWGDDMDYNIQVDVEAAQYVIEHSNPTLIPVSITAETSLRRAYLPRLRNGGALGQLLARQAEAFANDGDYEDNYGKTCRNLPDDTINFLHDPLACAIAAGWDEGIEIAEIPLTLELRNSNLYEVIDSAGKPTKVVTKIDGNRFDEFWLNTVSRVPTS